MNNHYEFEVGPVIATKKLKSNWRLHVRAMSGDADHYEHITNDFSDVDKLSKHFALLDAYCRLSWNAGCHEKSVKIAIRSAAELVELSPDKAMDWYSDFVGRDITCNDYYASPDRVWITYFDEDGVEHNVTINGTNDAARTRPVVLAFKK